MVATKTRTPIRAVVQAIMWDRKGRFQEPDSIEVAYDDRGTITECEMPFSEDKGGRRMVARRRDRSARANTVRESVHAQWERASVQQSNM